MSGETPRRLQRENLSFYRAAFPAVETPDRQIAGSRMAINGGVHRRPAASVTWIIEIKAQRHVTPPYPTQLLLIVRHY